MQWDGSANAGFTPAGIRPWLPVNPDYPQVNVAVEAGDPESLLELYRRLFAVRRAHPALHRGSLHLISGLPADVLGYRRTDPETGQQCAVFANLGRTERQVRAVSSESVVGTGGATCADGTIHLPPDSAIVVVRQRPGPSTV